MPCVALSQFVRHYSHWRRSLLAHCCWFVTLAQLSLAATLHISLFHRDEDTLLTSLQATHTRIRKATHGGCTTVKLLLRTVLGDDEKDLVERLDLYVLCCSLLRR